MNWNVWAGTFAAGSVALLTQACTVQSGSAAYRPTSAESLERFGSATASLGQSDPAAAERAVAGRMRAMERAACAAVPSAFRDDGPFGRRESIARLELLRDRPRPDESLQPAGVAIYLRPARDLTEQRLGQFLQCQLAHHAVAGDHGTSRASPLFVEDARVALSSTSDGFRIAITARDVGAAKEIIERARDLFE